MHRRAELTLLGLVGLAILAISLLLWGQQSGQLTIFGDALLSQVDRLPLTVPTEAVSLTTYLESFESLANFDPATTADWNIDAGEVTLPYGETEALVWSGQIANTTGGTVWVELNAREDRPAGSAIYYAVSGDDGVTWQTISATRPAIFTKPQGVWRWRALLNRGTAGRPPAIQNLELKLYAK